MTTTTASRCVLAAHILLVAACCAALGIRAQTQQQQRGGCRFARLFSFGDSITDNGNWLRYVSSPGGVASSPYGDTFFRRPTGRFCDGRIIIDYVGELSCPCSSHQRTYVRPVLTRMPRVPCVIDRAADALGLPFLTPYLAGNSSRDFANGANFAVGGATALGKDYFTAKNVDDGFTPSLQGQVTWFKNVTRMLATDEQGLSDLMASSLFLVGEIGGNDYNRPLFGGKSVDEVTTYIPDVVAAISSAVTELIGLGAKTIVVPGNFPIGCSPGYLTMFPTHDTAQFDATGCLRWANHLAVLHNSALVVELARIRRRHPGVAVVYADYYSAVVDLVANPGEQGFGDQPLVSCCGGGGPYNVNFSVQCGTSRSTACSDPGAAVSWDGFHFTEHAYKVIADGVLQGPYAVPSILTSCGIAGTGL
ncbi:hypothetical protein EJB05_10899, partial [Eragrostis curvula]